MALRSQPVKLLEEQQKPQQSFQQKDGGIGLTVTLQHSQEDVGRALQLFSFRLNSWGKIEVRMFALQELL